MSRPLALPLLAAALALAGCRGEGERAPAPPADSTLAGRLAAPAGAGSVRLVRVLSPPGPHAFAPAEVRLRPGDVLRFVHTGHLAESIAFDDSVASPAGSAWLRARRLTDATLLTHPGQILDVSFAGAPPGRYPFRSLAHAAPGTHGVAVVE